jgi:MarR family transcriptional regulator, lower aerobic nicotinate degradation pathway regulator
MALTSLISAEAMLTSKQHAYRQYTYYQHCIKLALCTAKSTFSSVITFSRYALIKLAKSTKNKNIAISFNRLIGHNIRRLQQIAVAIFSENTREYAVTPVQFAALQSIFDSPGLDQKNLADRIRFDTSTIGGVIDRLEARGLVSRGDSPDDRRVRLLSLTENGVALLAALQPAVLQTQREIAAPLSAAEQKTLATLIDKLLAAHDSMDAGALERSSQRKGR